MVTSDDADVICGHVTVYDNTVKVPNYSAARHTKILRVDSDNLYIYCMEWIPPSKWLLLGSKVLFSMDRPYKAVKWCRICVIRRALLAGDWTNWKIKLPRNYREK